MALQDGEFSVAPSFTLVQFNQSGGRFSMNYKPPKGRQFVTMLVGTIDKKETFADVDAMMRAAGWARV